MKKLPILIFALALAFAVGEAQARPGCVPYPVAVEMLTTKHHERLVMTGAWQGGAHIELWRTEDGATWTLLQVNAQGVACVGAAGKNWRDAEAPEPDGTPV
jgi:hypothetical protein